MAAKLKIKKGDQVIVRTGRDKGKTGEILRMYPKDNRALVQGVNMVKRHTQPSQTAAGGIIEKDTNPNTAGTFHMAGHGTPGGLDLTGGHPFRRYRLQAVGSEVQGRSSLGFAMDTSLVGLTELCSFRTKHLFYSLARAFISVAAAAPRPFCPRPWDREP